MDWGKRRIAAVGTWVPLDESGGRAWLARPDVGAGPGVLLLHAWWGLNGTFRDVADRLAAEGFDVLAPDLYRGEVVDTIEAAEAEVDKRSHSATWDLVRAAAERLVRDQGEIGRGIGIVGFSMGAFWALEVAAAAPETLPAGLAVDAVVLVYGTGREHDWSRSAAAFQGHFAADDPYESTESVDALEAALRAAGRTADFHRYPSTGHWFMEPDRPDAYNADAAELAFGRIVAFLRENLGPIGA